MSFTQRKISLVYSLVTAGILLPMSLFLIVNKGDQPSDKSRQRPADDPKFDVVALALNEVAETGRGLSLSHPNYKWLFTSTSLEMTPTSGAPSWTWTGHEANAFPRYVENKIIYERENLNEEYNLLSQDRRLTTGESRLRLLLPAPAFLPNLKKAGPGKMNWEKSPYRMLSHTTPIISPSPFL
jgi:hypothetical protein